MSKSEMTVLSLSEHARTPNDKIFEAKKPDAVCNVICLIVINIFIDYGSPKLLKYFYTVQLGRRQIQVSLFKPMHSEVRNSEICRRSIQKSISEN